MFADFVKFTVRYNGRSLEVAINRTQIYDIKWWKEDRKIYVYNTSIGDFSFATDGEFDNALNLLLNGNSP